MTRAIAKFCAYFSALAAVRRTFRALSTRRRRWTQILDVMHDRLEREPHRETIFAQRERQALYARIEELDAIEEAILYGSNHD